VAGAWLEAALKLARERHGAILAGDEQGYAEGEAPLLAACEALLEAGTDGLEADQLPALNELLALETGSQALLQAMIRETRDAMDALNRNKHARDAYGAQERLSVNGL
jgi:hypothetical protein